MKKAKLNSQEQVKLQMAYSHIIDAVNEIDMIRNKDFMLINAQTSLYRLEEVLHRYIEPVKKGE